MCLTMPLGPKATKSVLLSLTAVSDPGHDADFPERRIILTSDNDHITIGRSSKVSTKGFVAGEDNAWFDNPVMSRKHALLRANLDDKKVELADLGSLHGTYLNGDERLPKEQARQLKEGDIIKFGATIWQGTTQHVPTTVRVDFHFSECNAPRSFVVPDESDEDVSEEDMNDAYDNMKPSETTSRSQSQTSARNRPSNIEIIDLTGAPPIRNVFSVIDLSSPCSSPARVDNTPVLGNLADGQAGQDSDKTDGMSVNSDLPTTASIADKRNDAGNISPGTSDYDPEFDDGDLTWSDLDEEINDHDNAAESSIQTDDEAYQDQNNQEEYPEDESELAYSDDEGQGPYSDGDSQADSLDDDASHGDYADEGTGIENGNVDEYSEDEELGDAYPVPNSDLPLPPIRDFAMPRMNDRPRMMYDHDYPEIMPLVQSLSRPPVASGQRETASRSVNSCAIELLLNRDQAPLPVSDQDPAPESKDGPTSSSQDQEVVMSNTNEEPFTFAPTLSGAINLGAKTGKMEYFMAREENKLAVNSTKTSQARPASSVHDLCNATEPATELAKEPELPEDRHPQPLGAQPEPVSPFAELMAAFIGGAAHSPPREVAPRMDSPVSMGDEAEEPSCTLDQVVPETAASELPRVEGKLKRKAEEISDTTHEEEQWAAKFTAVLSPAPSIDGEQQSQHEEKHDGAPQETAEVSVQRASPERVQESDSTVAAPPVERPAKRSRMMRVAERLGYAALGGVTAGAVIVSTLIYTAPTFT
ncbi:hypothetical protein VTJ49DRAFT_2926 [Mycothermus thermophilus]|uniref:FHA domain-containing protein n=1 Tax=Humicola insolens TaxID=85995 RepID=A0ABR3V8X5_HUMIN